VPVSIAEDIAAFVTSLLAILIPLLMGILLVLLVSFLLWWLWKRTDKAPSA
jgi:hypothetical protein